MIDYIDLFHSIDSEVQLTSEYNFNFFLFTRSFKTFKLKKKSSTLGINKTSESPPLLVRRHDDQYDNQSLANGQLRHTIDIGLESSFQRGTPNRSSLQDLSSRVSIVSNVDMNIEIKFITLPT